MLIGGFRGVHKRAQTYLGGVDVAQNRIVCYTCFNSVQCIRYRFAEARLFAGIHKVCIEFFNCRSFAVS